jgi:hypothetical protein
MREETLIAEDSINYMAGESSVCGKRVKRAVGARLQAVD